MEYFLRRIAKSIHSEYGDDLRDHCLVFPGRRSGLFFLKYLSAEIDKPVWMPSVLTINELFYSLSKLRKAENEILLFELYRIFRKITKSSESFDEFYFWGDMLLNDFDDTDKYLADASKLFQNVSDLKKIDQQFGGLSPEQIEVVQRFWTNFDPDKSSDAKEKFINVWSVLGALYLEFKKSLTDKNLAYEGMIFREVTENPEFMRSPGFRWKCVHFIGFNALNECEKSVMLKLRESGKARFYWDYDNSYVEDGGLNSAGFFLRANLKMFGNDMPADWDYNTLISSDAAKVKRRVIETSSDIAQVKMIPGLIGEIPGLCQENAHDTAVVLADENLLMPVLSSLPDEVPDINITMGYPLKHTSSYSLVRYLLDLQRNAKIRDGAVLFGYEDVSRILKNEMVAGMLDDEERKIPDQIIRNNLIMVPSEYFRNSTKLSQIFKKPLSPAEISDYLKSVMLMIVNEETESTFTGSMPKAIHNEFIYRIILAINRLEIIINSPELNLTTDTWTRLLDRILRMQSVPFSGEPLSGIQIMGILETRALDFRNLIILSMNEGIMPAVTAASSFIPFSLRQAFGLPSVNHQESVYAYHFYRLLHRSENVTFLFNSNPEGLRSGEMSRFLQQMKYESLSGPESFNLSFKIRNPESVKNSILRTAVHNERLFSRFPNGNSGRPFSPSALNTWLSCRMKFYYQFVNGLSEPKKVITEIDPARLGSMVHAAIRNLYGNYIGKKVDREIISRFIEDRQALSELVNNSLNEVLKREEESFAAINEMMVREVLRNYVVRILETDKLAAPFTIVSIEQPYTFRLIFETDDGRHEIMAGGNIDRVDIKEGITRIVDYKTGITADTVAGIADLFKDDRDKEPDAWLQTLYYCEAYFLQNQDARVRPSVYRLKLIPGEKVTDKLILGGDPVENYSSVRSEFRGYLDSAVKTIFSSKEPFIMTSGQSKKCGYCPFRVLCQR